MLIKITFKKKEFVVSNTFYGDQNSLLTNKTLDIWLMYNLKFIA